MKLRFSILTISLILSYFVGRQIYHFYLQPDQDEHSTETIQKSIVTTGDTRPNLAEDSFINENPNSSTEAFAPPEGLAEQNELLITFNDANSYQEFLNYADENHLDILGQNSRLNSLRIRISNTQSARQIQNQVGNEGSTDYNYIVSAPQIPQPSLANGTTQPFSDQALDWLGVPRENQNWGEGVTIALLDTGVSDHIILGDENIERSTLIEPDSTESDYNGHGTAIASILVGNEGLGIAPASKLISIQVMDANGLGNSFTLAEGIVEAVDSGASVVSMSLGSYGYTRALENAVQYALSKDVALVAAVGNDSKGTVPYPAQFDGVIGVTAVDADSQRASFSNYGSEVDIAAPGVGVLAAWGDEQWISFSGTSAATPYVSGSIAATISLNPDLTTHEAVGLVLNYADEGGAPGTDNEIGEGVLNMDRVLNRNEPNIYDAALADFYLDLQNATDTTIPLIVSVENRGTERLSSVSVEITENDGIPQKIYLGTLQENDTASHTIYLDKSQLQTEQGYSIQGRTSLAGNEDSRVSNDSKTGNLHISGSNP